MRILFVGDVVGRPGRRILKPAIAQLRAEHAPDLIVVNGENASRGAGLTRQAFDEIVRAGADVITTGNHVWDRKEIFGFIDDHPRLLRPANYPEPVPGNGVCILQAADGTPTAVVNILGRLFVGDYDDPFRTIDRILDELDGRVEVVLVDFHAEATSEKIAFGWHVDGRVSAVLGTHTHVPTADERVLPGGTAYITDVGMTGPHDSVIGVDKQAALERFLTQRPVRFFPASDDVRLSGVVLEVSPADGRAESIRRVEVRP